MRFDGKNLKKVLEAHRHWLETGGENDEDRADFSDANLVGIPLAYANLYGANFRGANLRAANLFGSDLRRADFTGANLKDANLYYAKLRGAVNVPFIPQHVPDTGSFIGWKRTITAGSTNHYDNSVIVKLMIPEDAKRLSLPSGECRANKVVVLEIQTIEGEVLPDAEAISIKNKDTVYRVGETIEEPRFSDELYNEWAYGIYFFLDRRCAVEYLTLGSDSNGVPQPIDADKVQEVIRKDGGCGSLPDVNMMFI